MWRRWLLTKRAWLVLLGSGLLAAGVWQGPVLWRDYQIRRARRAIEAHKPETALSRLESARHLDPQHAETHFWLARTHRHLGQFDRVRKHLQRAWKLGYPVTKLEREQVLTLAQAGQLDAAEPQLDDLLQDPQGDGQEICHAFVSGFWLNFRLEMAFKLLDVWEQDFPEDPEPSFWRGFIHKGLHHPEQAVRAFRNGLAMAPDRHDARLRMAQALVELAKFEPAEKQFRRCLEAEPGNAEALAGLGECLRETGRRHEAATAYRRALEHDPQQPTARLGLGQIALADGDPERVINLVESVVEARPHDIRPRYLLARALQQAGRNDEAERHFRKVEQSEKPMQKLEALLGKLPNRLNDPDLRYEIAKILRKQGSHETAARWLRTVVRMEPNHENAHRALAEYYSREGLPERADRHRRLAGAAETASTVGD